jgi:hypothetical protein
MNLLRHRDGIRSRSLFKFTKVPAGTNSGSYTDYLSFQQPISFVFSPVKEDSDDATIIFGVARSGADRIKSNQFCMEKESHDFIVIR